MVTVELLVSRWDRTAVFISDVTGSLPLPEWGLPSLSLIQVSVFVDQLEIRNFSAYINNNVINLKCLTCNTFVLLTCDRLMGHPPPFHEFLANIDSQGNNLIWVRLIAKINLLYQS